MSKIEYDDIFYILCIPLYVMQEPPKEQKQCTVQQCCLCQCKMWVSKKKRKMAKNLKGKARILCMFCGAIEANKYGQEVEVIDLARIH